MVRVSIDNLVAVNSWGQNSCSEEDSLAESAKQWRAACENNLFIVSNCAHRLWLGSSEDFADFPEDGRTNLDFMTGPKAYSFMLRLLSGIESERLCETHVRKQVKQAWTSFQKYNPRTALAYEAVYGLMMKDSGFISDAVLSDYKELKHELSARDLSGQKKGDKVLIVADINRHGNVAQYTERMIRVSENKQNCLKDFLTLTHPDPAILEKIKSALESLQTDKKIKSLISFTPFDQLAEAVETNDRIYIDISMGSNPEADGQIIDVWKNRVRRDNTLTHMRGNPLARGLSDQRWLDADLDNFIATEDIHQDMGCRKKSNPLVISRAENLIEKLTEMRAKGISPRRQQLNEMLKSVSDAPELRAA